MAFNLGMALGGAAKAGIDTYTTLQKESREQEAEKRLQEQYEFQRQEQQSRKSAEAAYLAYQDPSMVKAGVQSSTEFVSDIGPDIKRTAITLTPADKEADYVTRLRETGANPLYAMQLKAAGLGIKGQERTEKIAAAEDAFNDWQQKSMLQINDDVVGFAKDNISAYNKAAKGSRLDDGLTAEIVPNAADPKSSMFVRKDKDGKIVDSTPITKETAMSVMQDIAFEKYKSLPGKFKEGKDLDFTKQRLGLEERRVVTDENTLKIKEALFPSEIEKNKGATAASYAAANSSNAHADLFRNAVAVSKTNKEAGDAMKPYIEKFSALSPEDQAGSKGQSTLLEMAVAGSKVSKDPTAIINALRKPGKAEITMDDREKIAYTALTKMQENNPDMTPVQIATAATKLGLDINKFGLNPQAALKTPEVGKPFFGGALQTEPVKPAAIPVNTQSKNTALPPRGSLEKTLSPSELVISRNARESRINNLTKEYNNASNPRAKATAKAKLEEALSKEKDLTQE